MATKLYPIFKQAIMQGTQTIAWKASAGDTIRAFLINTTNYTYSDAHDFLDDVPTNSRAGASGASTRASAIQITLIDAASGGICDGNDITFTAIPAGTTYSAIILFKDDGSADASSPLIAYIDSTGATGLPIASNGGDIGCAWSNAAAKIFTI